jgi:hypothetical protein
MKTLRTKTGPFTERPYFEADDIENICSDELRKVGLYPDRPEAIRIDRFIEKRFSIAHRYDDLPKGVLGLTRFGKNGVEDIVVAKALDEEGTEVAERRIITTLGHEAGHGLLHTYLFALGNPKSLFDESASDEPLILCRDEMSLSNPRYSGHWWEFQANQAMAALLIPRNLAATATGPYLIKVGCLGTAVLNQNRRDDAVKTLAKIFQVNPTVARLRLEIIYPDTPQMSL